MPVAARPYPVVLLLEGRRVLVVGGGAVAASKVAGLLAAGAVVHVVAREVSDGVRGPARHLGGAALRPGEAAGYRFVVACHRRPGGEPPGVRRRRGRRHLGQRRRRPGQLLGHPPGPPRPGTAAGHRVHLGAQPGAGRLAPRPPRRAARTGARRPSSSCSPRPGRRWPQQGLHRPVADWRAALDSGMLDDIRAGRLAEAKERLSAALHLGEGILPE